jgi:hypothetical protein
MIGGEGPDPINQLLASTLMILAVLLLSLLGAWLLFQ